VERARRRLQLEAALVATAGAWQDADHAGARPERGEHHHVEPITGRSAPQGRSDNTAASRLNTTKSADRLPIIL
jgi:hypothetical protein